MLFALSLLLRPCNDSEADEFTSFEVLNITLSPKNMRKNIVSMKDDYT